MFDPAAIRADNERRRRAVEEWERNAPVFPVPSDGPLAGPHRLLDAIVTECVRTPGHGWPEWFQTAGGRRVAHLAPEERAALAVAAVERAAWGARVDAAGPPGAVTGNYLPGHVARALLEDEGVPLRTEELLRMMRAVLGITGDWLPWYVPLDAVVLRVAHGFAAPGADPVLRPDALRLRKLLVPMAFHETDRRDLLQALESALLGGRTAFLDLFEPWAARVVDDVEAMAAEERGRWTALLDHLRSLQSVRPSGKWSKAARAQVAAVGADAFRSRAAEWIAAMREGADEPVSARNGDLARGLAWCLAGLGGDDDAQAIGDLALLCAAKIPEIGQRSAKVLNACIAALGEMPGDAAMAQITRLRARVKYVQAQALIERTLLAAAARRGVPPGELEELAAPLFGMDEPGVLRQEEDGWTAEVRVTGTTSVETAWIAPGGARQKSVPAALKAGHGEVLKGLKKTEKEMAEALAAQRARIEALPMEERAIPYAAWRERYLDHPLLAEMCRRLVWRFERAGESVSGAWRDGELVDADGRPLQGLDGGSMVRPWHPIDAAAEEIAAWRGWLERHGVTQPFKQAHREVYRLTDAERDARIYSNRFAAHVLRQHQLAALCRGRGWQYQMQGSYDLWSAPTLRLPLHGLRVELRVNAVEGHGAAAASGVARFVTTDQVRFLDAADRPVPLEEVPPLAFSEAMRDVDLFVGVASVGTDPTWVDGGPIGVGGYWTEFAFGELSATAATRREVLQRLLPRLRIAEACALDDRFLVVRGSLRTYRIHLGSGNVLMEPGSEYLCIVPDRRPAAAGEADALPLPFEGDVLLSVILSKAFLLSADTRITDRTILAQIRPPR
ncbi:MAG TPA: DUF4132 domain-containing protein [Longimicrobium sp.]|nr:DUF4132 domain-containing protein [Longimicrobium sp.]